MEDTGLLDRATLDRLADAVVALDPQLRQRRWVSLSLCIVDAVWSIGANYDKVVVPLARKLAAKLGVEQPTIPAQDPIGADPLPATRLTQLDLDVLTGLTNRQRTSTRHGILKADAVLRHAHVFVEHGVTTLPDALDLFTDEHRFSAVDAAVRSIPCEGAHGIRRNYLWMLVWQNDLIKPDRMVLRWFDHHGVVLDPAGARNVIAKLVTVIGPRLSRDVTAWEIDRALWSTGRGLPRR
jgi:hypothetical protein